MYTLFELCTFVIRRKVPTYLNNARLGRDRRVLIRIVRIESRLRYTIIQQQ